MLAAAAAAVLNQEQMVEWVLVVQAAVEVKQVLVQAHLLLEQQIQAAAVLAVAIALLALLVVQVE